MRLLVAGARQERAVAQLRPAAQQWALARAPAARPRRAPADRILRMQEPAAVPLAREAAQAAPMQGLARRERLTAVVAEVSTTAVAPAEWSCRPAAFSAGKGVLARHPILASARPVSRAHPRRLPLPTLVARARTA